VVAWALLAAALACSRPVPEAAPRPRAATAIPDQATTPAPLSIVRTEGQVWRARAGAGEKPAGAGEVAPGDVLSAGENGRVFLRLADGRELVLEPRARLRVGAQAGGALSVELERGEILSRSPARAPTGEGLALTVLTPMGITRVPNEAGEARIAVRDELVQIDVGVGQIAFLDRTGRETTAAANQRIEVSVGALRLLPLGGAAERPATDVVLPTQRGLRVYADGLREVTLSWPSELRGAEVEVARDAGFKQLLRTEKASLTQLTVPAPRRGELFWRVAGGEGPAARRLLGHARFRPDRPPSALDLARPQNLIEEAGQATTVYFQAVRPDLTFSFAPTSGAQRYRLRIFRAGALEAPLFEDVIAGTRASVPASVLDEGDYLWHAQALDGTGRALGGGRMNKLTIAYDNALTTLAIASPRPGERIAGNEVKVSGVAPLGSRLYVNGRHAPTDEKGRFDMRIQASPSVVFRLVGKNGGESYWVRKLRVGS
jgi:hypothetical protein